MSKASTEGYEQLQHLSKQTKEINENAIVMTRLVEDLNPTILDFENVGQQVGELSSIVENIGDSIGSLKKPLQR
ncbi:hypothetical protein [Ureibacillus sp. GCM10028918]|uniref:hypothetical protein n=1 Tax=Ureibacillus sp. GCM10028918 TaxID=3273429 RepID=UPI0036183642